LDGPIRRALRTALTSSSGAYVLHMYGM
jgi:hypothetical protein